MADAVLVIGGGIAGIEAALNLADYGVQVYLVDDTPSIGGVMARLDKTFPTNDCSICIEAPKMYEVQKHPNIEVLSNTEVRRARRRDGGFRVRVLTKARFVVEERCTACGKCVEACPVSVPDELDGRIFGTRKLVWVPFPQAVPNVMVIDPDCRWGRKRADGACIGDCKVDCIQCRECPIALCVKACRDEGKDAIELWARDAPRDLEVRAIIVATGVEVHEPPPGTLGYGRFPDVITHMEFERLMNAGGPTGGEIVRPSDRSVPESIFWVQCIGRGMPGGVPYCSRVCCMVAAKQTIITKEHHTACETTVLHNELKCYGKGFHEFARRARSHGVRFVHGRPSDVWKDPGDGALRIRYEDVDEGKVVEPRADLIVLSTALGPAGRNKRLAKALKIELDEQGFFRRPDPLGDPLGTGVDGIYLCGGATGPIDISESVAQAAAASLRAVLPRCERV
jgi:heterodisulfide reductase subunit A